MDQAEQLMSERENILLLSSWYPTYRDPNAGLFVRYHAIEISKSFNVDVLCFEFSATPGGLLFGSKVEHLNARLREEHILLRDCGKILNNLLLLIVANWMVIRKLVFSSTKYALVNLNVVYHIGVMLYPVLITLRPRLVITEHWTGYFEEDGRYAKLSALTRGIIGSIYALASKVIVVSRALGDQLDQFFKTAARTEVVPNSLRIPRDVRSLDALELDTINILTISYMDDRMKGIRGLIDAFAQVYATDSRLKLTIVGGGEDLEMLKDYAYSKGAAGARIFFTGAVANNKIGTFYQQAAFFVLNSKFETFSIVTAEALLYGLPVIVTKCRGPEEYMREEFGLLIQKENKVELTQAIQKMKEKFRNYKEQEIRSKAREIFEGEEISERFKVVFNSVLRRS